jgi:hypothetical protein
MAGPSSRRPPWPDDLQLGGHGLNLVDGALIGKKTQTLENVVPTAQEYDAAPIYKERTFPFRPTRGMGERLQSSHTSRRYRYGLNVWVTGGVFGKGPLTHSLSPGTTGSIRQFTEALDAGTLTQFILAGASVLKRTNDTSAGQTVSETRAGNTATSAVRFKGAYASPVDGLYVAWSDGVLREYNGSAWNACTMPAGFLPQFLEVVGDELWAADATSSVVRKVQGDPKSAGNWSGAILIGNPSVKISGLKQVLNRLVVFKEDGSVFTFNADGTDNDLFPGLRGTIDPTNGRTATAWLDSLWFRSGPSFYRLHLGGGAQLEQVGPGRLQQNDSEVRGPVQAFAGWSTSIGFAAIYNASLNASYLLSYGSWQPPNDQDDAEFHYVDQWDGALVKWAGKQATAMGITSVASPDTRLYIGFSDGTYDWIKLVQNPLTSGSGAEFTLGSSKIYIPLHHAMFQAEWKAIMGFSAFGPVLSAQDFVQVAYRADGSTAAYTGVPGSFTTTGMRLDTPQGTAMHLLDTEISLFNSSTSDTPVLEGIAIHERVVPNLKRDFSGPIDARNNVARRDGSTSRLMAEEIRDIVLQAAGAPGSVTMVMPDETVQGLAFFEYQERLLPRNQRNGLGWVIDFVATQFTVSTVTGTVGRFKGVLIGDLKGIAIQQLKTW